jgi:hypothetical protein
MPVPWHRAGNVAAPGHEARTTAIRANDVLEFSRQKRFSFSIIFYHGQQTGQIRAK